MKRIPPKKKQRCMAYRTAPNRSVPFHSSIIPVHSGLFGFTAMHSVLPFDFLVRTSSENSPTTKPSYSCELLVILNKLQILLGRLNEKFRPNPVRFRLARLATNNFKCHKHRNFPVCTSSENSSTTKAKHFSEFF